MSVQVPTSDAGLLDLLRITGPLGVAELADAMEVTPTAVRQRLTRLMARDADGDGKVTAAELPKSMRFLVRLADANKDGALDQAEAEQLDAKLGGGPTPADAKPEEPKPRERGQPG